jgi:hypothetical protein
LKCIPYLLKKYFSGQNFPFVIDEIAQKLKLFGGKINRISFTKNGCPAEIDPDGSELM